MKIRDMKITMDNIIYWSDWIKDLLYKKLNSKTNSITMHMEIEENE